MTGAATVVAGVAGAVAVTRDVLPGRVPLERALGHCGVDVPDPGDAPGPLVRGRFGSARRGGREVGWVLALPPGTPRAGLPLVLVLHGRGAGAATAFDGMHWHRFLAAHVAAGGPPVALAAADGGDRYWHPRADGDDPLGMLTHELLPLLAARGLETARVGVMGWSMGGYGALLLARESSAGRLPGTRVVAAAAASPALFADASARSAGSFDSADDFVRWGTLADEPGVSRDVALHVVCGDADAFTATTRRYRSRAAEPPEGGISRGCHDAAFWRAHAREQIAFLAGHLHS